MSSKLILIYSIINNNNDYTCKFINDVLRKFSKNDNNFSMCRFFAIVFKKKWKMLKLYLKQFLLIYLCLLQNNNNNFLFVYCNLFKLFYYSHFIYYERNI